MSGNPISRSVWQIAAGWAGLWTPESKAGEFEGSYVRRFVSEAKVGDVFVRRNGTRTIVAIGLVATLYSFEHACDVNGWELEACAGAVFHKSMGSAGRCSRATRRTFPAYGTKRSWISRSIRELAADRLADSAAA